MTLSALQVSLSYTAFVWTLFATTFVPARKIFGDELSQTSLPSANCARLCAFGTTAQMEGPPELSKNICHVATAKPTSQF